ncbi:MAG: hypothetical protein ACI9HA_003675, partial [Dinoroseobacter sp.]
QWYESGRKMPARLGLVGFDFPAGTLGLKEGSQKHRASLHLVRSADELEAFDDRRTMAVHGKFKQPCPDCGNAVKRIQYASNERNYCAACQNQGNLLADRSFSRLLKKDWPKTLEELER